MAKYMYGWDSVNHKKEYKGKYPDANPRGQGYFGRNTAGNPQFIGGNTAGIQREFIGSDTEEYTFYNEKHGTHTITARSYEEALRIANSMGYTAADYRKKPKRGR